MYWRQHDAHVTKEGREKAARKGGAKHKQTVARARMLQHRFITICSFQTLAHGAGGNGMAHSMTWAWQQAAGGVAAL